MGRKIKGIVNEEGRTCTKCGETFDKKHPQAHHITPVVCSPREQVDTENGICVCSPMEQVDIENGICVCKECHINIHLNQEGITYAELIKVGNSTNEDNNNIDKED
jgi:5-methylcytosine-specific restriction endonuclease McrA